MPASEPAQPNRIQAYLIAGLVHAGAMLLAFPPLGLWGFALIAPMPLIWAAWIRAKDIASGRKATRWSGPLVIALGVLPFHAYSQQWVLGVSAPGFVPMVVILALFSSLLVWGLSRVRIRWARLPLAVGAPVMWAAVEVFRGEVFFSGYPWHMIAHPLVDAPLIPAAAAFLGTYFVGFLVVTVAAALVDWIAGEAPRRWTLGAIGLAICLVGLAVVVRPGPGSKDTVLVGVVQTNIPQSNKQAWEFEDRLRDFDRFCALTRQAAGIADVVIWPETMFPGLTLSESGLAEERSFGLTFEVPRTVDPRGIIPSTEFADRLLGLSKETGVPLVVGALGFDGLKISPSPGGGVEFSQRARYNSVFLVSGGSISPEPYHKIDLTPFGEVMPGINRWPWLQARFMALGAGGMTFDLSRGRAAHVFELGGRTPWALVTPICFEATKAGLCRRLVRAAGDRPVLMANLTNDGWFGGFRIGRVHHFQVARWRCIELGVPMVRAANTGISGIIDGRGRVLKSGVDGAPGGWRVEGVLSGDVVPQVSRTVYARVGDAFGWTAMVLAGLGVAGSYFRRGVNDGRSESMSKEAQR